MAVCPFADQSKRYDGRYPGSYVTGFGYRGVLHSTETTGLPSYQSGSVAPHFTVDPRTGRIWQHYDTGRPSRALKHPSGTVQTNNARAIQIEIVAYSDTAIAARVGGVVVDRLTPAQLAPVAKLMRWIETTHKVASASGLTFRSYPASAGTGNGVRLGATAWTRFGGWCGHQHVPANVHGDPSDIAINRLLAQVSQGDDMTPAEVTAAVKAAAATIATTVWQAKTTMFGDTKGEPVIAGLRRMYLEQQSQKATLAAHGKAIAALSTSLPASVQQAVEKALADGLVDVNVTVNGEHQ